MRKALPPEIERCRIDDGPPGPAGIFSLLHPGTGRRLEVMVTDGSEWFEEKKPLPAHVLERMPRRAREVHARKFASGPYTLPAPAWEHASVRVVHMGMPRWEEMCWVKDVFWGPEECVLQFHPPESEYVNDHERVLHLWKPVGLEFPRPPKEAV